MLEYLFYLTDSRVKEARMLVSAKLFSGKSNIYKAQWIYTNAPTLMGGSLFNKAGKSCQRQTPYIICTDCQWKRKKKVLSIL
jgi:hypothetical protein